MNYIAFLSIFFFIATLHTAQSLANTCDMPRTILITGSTDGIGLETAKKLVNMGHTVLLHGRNAEKLKAAAKQVSPGGNVKTYQADLSRIADVEQLAKDVIKDQPTLDVLINNAGILQTSDTRTSDGLDVRFAVNTIAPYLLTQRLLPLIPKNGRIINLSSAAQATVNLSAMAGNGSLAAMQAYSQSKLAITMWSHQMALDHRDGPSVVAVNPGSLLGTKMVREGFGTSGNDVQIGVDILIRAALGDVGELKNTGRYFDNDSERFSTPHAYGAKCKEVTKAIDDILEKLL
jgi:NAD(P)-dependent dehydrogenase (short-subunit alcohol dehydrogenase family)